jgi:hypothetical protein
LMIGASLFLLAVLLADKPPVTPAMLLAAAFLAMVLLPLAHFAQREHLSMIGAVAYFALIARRIDERETDWRAAAVVGLIGGMGLPSSTTSSSSPSCWKFGLSMCGG